jgi:hypothetical protein
MTCPGDMVGKAIGCVPERSEIEMLSSSEKHTLNLNEARVVQDRVKWLNDNMPLWMFPYFHAADLDFEGDVHQRMDPVGHLSSFYIHQWMILNMWHRGLRCSLYILYAVGLALIAFPAATTFLQVTWIPVKHFTQ